MSSNSQWKEDLKNPWLRGILGTVLLALIVNGVLITLSFYYPHSLVAKDYYKKGKDYFHTMEQENKAESLGYKLKLNVPQKMKVNSEEDIFLKVIDRNGNVVKKGAVKLYAYRTNDITRDFQKTLLPTLDGQFTTKVKFSLPGNWDLLAQIMVLGEKLDVAERIFVEK